MVLPQPEFVIERLTQVRHDDQRFGYFYANAADKYFGCNTGVRESQCSADLPS